MERKTTPKGNDSLFHPHTETPDRSRVIAKAARTRAALKTLKFIHIIM